MNLNDNQCKNNHNLKKIIESHKKLTILHRQYTENKETRNCIII